MGAACSNVEGKGDNDVKEIKEPIQKDNTLKLEKVRKDPTKDFIIEVDVIVDEINAEEPTNDIAEGKVIRRISHRQRSRRHSIDRDEVATDFLNSLTHSQRIFIDELLELIPSQLDSEVKGSLNARKALFAKLDLNKDQLLNMDEFHGLKKHLLISTNFKCDIIFNYAFMEALDQVEASQHSEPNQISFYQFRIALLYVMQFITLIHLFYELLNKGEQTIKMEGFIENRILLEQEGFDMENAEELFKTMDTDKSGKIDIIEFLKQTIKLKTDLIESDTDLDLSKYYQ